MIWLFLAWTVGALLFWLIGRPIAGASPAGRRALPVVALGWPVFTALAAMVALVAVVEAICDMSIDEVFGAGDGQ